MKSEFRWGAHPSRVPCSASRRTTSPLSLRTSHVALVSFVKRHPFRQSTVGDGRRRTQAGGDRGQQLGVKFYFATPYHSWERGTNENTNGLIRQYLPKRQCLKWLTQRECDHIAKELNDRPRARLGFRTPAEVFQPC